MSQLTWPTAGLAVFPLFAGAAVLRGSHRAEQPLFAKASAGEAVAQLWQAPQDWWCRGAIVSLRICRRSARILPRAAGRYGFAAPAAVCAPGPGIINLSLARRCSSRSAKPPNRSIIRCARCCSVPSRASALPATPGGKRFLCDGRYNLACGEGEARKIVGTAQYWRPLTAGRGHVVLAHAVIH